MADEETGLESTIEITDGDYPEIMRTWRPTARSTRTWRARASRRTCSATTRIRAGLCANERAALGGSLLYVVEVGEVTDASESDGRIILAMSAAASLMASLTEVSNEGLQLAAPRGDAFGCRGPTPRDVRAARPRRRPIPASGRGAHDPHLSGRGDARRSVDRDDPSGVGRDPLDQRQHPIHELAPEVGERVLDAGRHFGVRRALDDAVGLERAQGRGEHLLADALDLAAQLAPRCVPSVSASSTSTPHLLMM